MQKILLTGSSSYYLRETSTEKKEIVTFSEHFLQ